MSILNSIMKQWQFALKYEAKTVKKMGGDVHLLKNGECLLKEKNQAIYRFKRGMETIIPERSSIKASLDGKRFQGSVIQISGSDMIISLTSFIGNRVKELEIHTEPWQLLIELSNRLEEAKEKKSKLQRIQRVLKPGDIARHPTDIIKNGIHELMLRTKYNPATYLWGPPGTGKTYTLARIAARKYIKGQKVLILAHSNASLDVLMEETALYLEANDKWIPGEVIRYGNSSDSSIAKHPSLFSAKWVESRFPHLAARSFKSDGETDYHAIDISSRQLFKDKEASIINQAKIVGATLSKAATDQAIYLQSFDLVIVDEASMAYVPQIGFAASLGKRILISGDFRQLPPVAISDHKYVTRWLKEDIFHRAGIVKTVETQNRHPHLYILNKQRRMHPDISSFTNRHVYGGHVEDHPSVRYNRKSISEKKPFSQQAAIWVNTQIAAIYGAKDQKSHSRFHLYTALMSIQNLLEAQAEGTSSIGFISPYRAQAKLVNTLLEIFFPEDRTTGDKEGLAAATIHRFQGSERDMVLFDTVDCSSHNAPGRLLTNEQSLRLVNVAVTRARGKFVAFGDAKFLKQKTASQIPVRKLLDHLHSHHAVKQPSIINKHVLSLHKRLRWYRPNEVESLVSDLQKAKKEVILSTPHWRELGEEVKKSLMKMNEEVKVKLIANSTTSIPLKRFHPLQCSYTFPFIVIDRKVMWIGGEQLGINELQPARLWTKKGIQLLFELMNVSPQKSIKIKSFLKSATWKSEVSLGDYITKWTCCPFCDHHRTIRMHRNGKVLFSCSNCGQERYLTVKQVQVYLEHKQLLCPDGHQDATADKVGGDIFIKCNKCESMVGISHLY
ncbi:DEAD/DEAH box helicase [Falsibacillus albus]|uniref:DNA helicase n=1 Tax=Falsibacillus albus TaxID=2478915 RepID=A0A3L7JZK4_9BACI|nr:AAA domain-containing protein [Falsibacillus albus]RLQ96176.1 DNA helicase [Falsibacillus albus]